MPSLSHQIRRLPGERVTVTHEGQSLTITVVLDRKDPEWGPYRVVLAHPDCMDSEELRSGETRVGHAGSPDDEFRYTVGRGAGHARGGYPILNVSASMNWLVRWGAIPEPEGGSISRV